MTPSVYLRTIESIAEPIITPEVSIGSAIDPIARRWGRGAKRDRDPTSYRVPVYTQKSMESLHHRCGDSTVRLEFWTGRRAPIPIKTNKCKADGGIWLILSGRPDDCKHTGLYGIRMRVPMTFDVHKKEFHSHAQNRLARGHYHTSHAPPHPSHGRPELPGEGFPVFARTKPEAGSP